jgi:hypothetical protein
MNRLTLLACLAALGTACGGSYFSDDVSTSDGRVQFVINEHPQAVAAVAPRLDDDGTGPVLTFQLGASSALACHMSEVPDVRTWALSALCDRGLQLTNQDFGAADALEGELGKGTLRVERWEEPLLDSSRVATGTFDATLDLPPTALATARTGYPGSLSVTGLRMHLERRWSYHSDSIGL